MCIRDRSKFDDLTIRLDLTKEWDALDNGSQLNTAGLVVRTEFAKEHPEAVAAFLKEYAASTQYVNENAVSYTHLDVYKRQEKGCKPCL